MKNLGRRMLVLGTAAFVPMALTTVIASASGVQNPGLNVNGVGNPNCLTVQSGTVSVDGSGGLVFINASGVAVQGLDCWV